MQNLTSAKLTQSQQIIPFRQLSDLQRSQAAHNSHSLLAAKPSEASLSRHQRNLLSSSCDLSQQASRQMENCFSNYFTCVDKRFQKTNELLERNLT